jgi:hypothetical protein
MRKQSGGRRVFTFEGPKSDEARKTCERAEYYLKKLRSGELRFNQNANEIKIEDPMTKSPRSMPDYVSRYMANYDHEKVNEAEYQIKIENLKPEDQLAESQIRKNLDLIAGTKYLLARNILSVIDIGLTSPLRPIEEGEAFFSKLKESDDEKKNIAEERDQFRGELEKVSADYIALKALYDDCQRKLHIRLLGGNEGEQRR